MTSKKTPFLLFLLLMLILPMTNHAADEYTNESNDAEETRVRVRFTEFDLLLWPTASALTAQDEQAVHGAAESVLEEYVREQLDPSITLDYIYLAGVTKNTFWERRLQASQTTVLTINGGVASFAVSNDTIATPTASQLDQWVTDSLQTNLQTLLTGDLSNVTQVTVFRGESPVPSSSSSMTPSLSPVNPPFSFGGVVGGSVEVRQEGDTTTVAASVSAAFFVIALALAIYVLTERRRKRRQETEDEADNPSVQATPNDLHTKTPQSPAWSRSGADSVSEFTVNTEQDDHLTVKSSSYLVTPELLLQQESFERDRQVVSIQKDMLQTWWNNTGAWKREVSNDDASSFAPDLHWNPDEPDDASKAKQPLQQPFMFEEAGEGEEIYLMPTQDNDNNNNNNTLTDVKITPAV